MVPGVNREYPEKTSQSLDFQGPGVSGANLQVWIALGEEIADVIAHAIFQPRHGPSVTGGPQFFHSGLGIILVVGRQRVRHVDEGDCVFLARRPA